MLTGLEQIAEARGQQPDQAQSHVPGLLPAVAAAVLPGCSANPGQHRGAVQTRLQD